MDLASRDLINKYYTPCETKVNQIFKNISKNNSNLLIGFIDVIEKDLLDDRSQKIVITDQLIKSDLYPEKTILKLPDSIFGIYFIPDPIPPKDISKDFNLFMNRADVNRLFWFYKIIEMGLLDAGAVSYIGSTERSVRPDLNCLNFLDLLHRQYFYPSHIRAHKFAQKSIPFQNFIDQGDLRNTILETKLSVVVETYHERSDAIAFSEKIFRAIQTPRPWVLSGATGSVDRLRSMGFDVFDDYVDHGYDSYETEHSIADRDSAILKEVMRFKNFNVTPSVLDDWNKKYQKNLKILSHWNSTWEKDLQEFVKIHFQNNGLA